ncbi:paramyosin-like protein [Willisornis vidua]|uniref:Paramyosin-like protein n=1 Tax=Willisornis vidua TaxID=1566151 RepID=A0ABQ9DAR2_9PASS|nr:paramyosin-like protein [Willisornis vidua]
MEISRRHPLPPARRPWKALVAATLGVAIVILAVTVPTLLCHSAEGSAGARNASEGLARLEKALAVTNRSLAEARGQWDGCRKELGVLEGKAFELELALANMTRLEEENRELRAELSQQREQLEEEQTLRLEANVTALGDELVALRRERAELAGDKVALQEEVARGAGLARGLRRRLEEALEQQRALRERGERCEGRQRELQDTL